MATTKNLCAQIPIALHERVSEERERLGQTTSEYIANLIQEYAAKLLPADPCHFRPTLPGAWIVRHRAGRACQVGQLH